MQTLCFQKIYKNIFQVRITPGFFLLVIVYLQVSSYSNHGLFFQGPNQGPRFQKSANPGIKLVWTLEKKHHSNLSGYRPTGFPPFQLQWWGYCKYSPFTSTRCLFFT